MEISGTWFLRYHSIFVHELAIICMDLAKGCSLHRRGSMIVLGINVIMPLVLQRAEPWKAKLPYDSYISGFSLSSLMKSSMVLSIGY